MYVKAPPRLGSSSATAAVITDAAKAAPRPAAHNPALNIIAFLREFSDRVGGSLLIEIAAGKAFAGDDLQSIFASVMAYKPFQHRNRKCIRSPLTSRSGCSSFAATVIVVTCRARWSPNPD